MPLFPAPGPPLNPLLAYEMITGKSPRIVDAQKIVRRPPSVRNAAVDHRGSRFVPRAMVNMVCEIDVAPASDRYPNLDAVLHESRILEHISLSIAMDSYRRCAAKPDFDAGLFKQFLQRVCRHLRGSIATL